jgi:hypothetical protein
MVNHTCLKCLKIFDKKSTYDYHVNNKKRPCKQTIYDTPILLQNTPILLQNTPVLLQNTPTISKVSSDVNNILNCCNFCGLVFKRKDNLKRHLSDRCKVKKLQHEEKETILELLEQKDKKLEERDKKLEERDKKLEEKDKQIEELKNMILELNKKVDKELCKAQTQNINKGINIGVLNNITIPQNKLVNFGEEDIKKIPKEYLNKIIGLSGYPALVGCCKAIHNNPDFPEGMNAFISDRSRNKGMIWKDGEWIRAPVSKIFNTVMNKIDSYINYCEAMILSGKYNSKKDPKGKEILDMLQQRIKKYYDRYVGDDTTVSSKVKKDFEKMVKDNIIAELCSMKKSVMNNYNKILEDLEKNETIKDKDVVKKTIIENRDLMINKIEDIKENSMYIKNDINNKVVNLDNSNSDSDDTDNSDNSDDDLDDSDNESIDNEYELKDVTLASGLVVKKWLKKGEEYWV